MSAAPRKYSLQVGTYGTTQQFVGAGQVLFPTNGLSLVGCKIYFDSLGAPPVVWSAGLVALDLGRPFSVFWIVGAVTAGGDLLVGQCGFRPYASTLDPAPVELLPEAGTPVVSCARGVGMLGALQDPSSDNQILRGSTDGSLCIATYNGGGVTNNVASPNGAIDSGYQGAIAVGGISAQASLAYNQAIPASSNYAILLPQGSPRQWKRACIKLNLTGSAGNLVLQASYYDDFEGAFWFTVMGGASGAGLAAGRYVYSTDGINAKELTGQAPAILLPAFIAMQQAGAPGIFRLLNTSASVAETLTSGQVCVDNF